MEKHKRVLLTGGHGFIGCHIANLLNKQGHTVGVVDSYRNYNHYNQHNIGEYEKVLKLRIDHAGKVDLYKVDILDEKSSDELYGLPLVAESVKLDDHIPSNSRILKFLLIFKFSIISPVNEL